MPLSRSRALSTLIFCGNVQAALDEQGRKEVNELLAFVESSGCRFIRNGSKHSPASNCRDLEEKGLLNSPEDFITRAATASSMSDEPLLVNCRGKLQPSPAGSTARSIACGRLVKRPNW